MGPKYKADRTHKKRTLGWLILGLILIVTTVASIGLLQRVPKEEIIEVVPPVVRKEPKEPEIVSVESRLLFTGETFWGRRIEQRANASELGVKYPFAKLNGFNKDAYDAWLTHLECPVSQNLIPYEVQVNQLLFNCDPSYLTEYAKWFDIVSLANNHTDNAGGLDGFLETRQNLEKAGILHYGHYDNAITDEICEIVPIPVRVVFDDGSIEASELPVAMCGYNNVFRLPTIEELDVIRSYSQHFITIISPQMGAEYVPTADEFKENTYRGMIDRGADLVAASHPHWVQNTEVYKDKLIMYSLGNFMFDQEWSEDVKKGVALDANFLIDHDDNMAALLELGESCQKFADDCLAQAKTQALTKPKFTVKYELVVSEFANSQTFPASPTVVNEMLERTNWEQTKKDLAN